MPLLFLLVLFDFNVDSVFKAELSFEFCLFFPLSFLQFMLYSLSLYSRSPHDFFLMPTPIEKILLLFPFNLVLVGQIEPALERIQILAKNFKIDISIAPPPHTMQKVVKLFVSHVKVILEKELSELRNTNDSFLVIIELFESIVGLYISDLFSNHLEDSKTFEELHQEGNEMTFDFGC